MPMVLHTGGYEATEEEVRAIETPEPQGSRHQPVPYGVFLDELQEAFDYMNLDWGQTRFALARGGKQLFGYVDAFKMPENVKNLIGIEHGFAAGFRNSHDMSFANQVAAGMHVFVCDNLSFSGDVVFNRRHTLNVLRDLPRGIRMMLAKAQEKYHRLSEVVDAMQTRNLTRAEVNDLLMQSVLAKAVSPQHLLLVHGEWRKPSTPQFAQMEPTMWRLFNAFTEVAKRTSPRVQQEKTPVLTGVFSQFLTKKRGA